MIGCPFPACSHRRSRIKDLRTHINNVHGCSRSGWRPEAEWVALHQSKLCPSCLRLISSGSVLCKLSPVLEKVGVLGHKDLSKRRPGDVTIPLWAKGRGLCVDVSVICPVANSHLHQREPCEAYAAHNKHALYDAAFRQQSTFSFAAAVFETTGGVNEEGLEFLRKLLRFGSKRECITHSVYAGRAWQRLSCVIQFGSAQMVLNRS